MSFASILRRSLPTWLLWAAPLAVAATNAWERHAPLPEPRTEVAAAVARGHLGARLGQRRVSLPAGRSRGRERHCPDEPGGERSSQNRRKGHLSAPESHC